MYLVFESNPGVNWSMTLDVFEAIGAGVGEPPAGTPVIDNATQGNWIGKYGELGYAIPNIGTVLPSGVTVTPATGTAAYTWEQTATNAAALQLPPAGTSRRASTWFSPPTAQVDVGIPAGEAYELSVYYNSFDASRQSTITLTRPDGSLIGPAQAVTDNKHGVWLTYQVAGPVQVRAAKGTGPNAVIGGIFLDEADSPSDEVAPTVSADAGRPGASGWFTDDVSVELTADDGAGSGVESIEYSIGDGDWASYDEPITVTEDGETLIRYRATDRPATFSQVGELAVKLDAAVPTVIATTVEAPADSQWATRGITLTLTADDGPGWASPTCSTRSETASGSPTRLPSASRPRVRAPSTTAPSMSPATSAPAEFEMPGPPALDVRRVASTRCIAGKVLVVGEGDEQRGGAGGADLRVGVRHQDVRRRRSRQERRALVHDTRRRACRRERSP